MITNAARMLEQNPVQGVSAAPDTVTLTTLAHHCERMAGVFKGWPEKAAQYAAWSAELRAAISYLEAR